MPRPQAYAPEHGQKYQILCMNPAYDRAYEHCDYARDRQERDYLLGEYRLAYGAGYTFKTILLPWVYWPKPETVS